MLKHFNKLLMSAFIAAGSIFQLMAQNEPPGHFGCHHDSIEALTGSFKTGVWVPNGGVFTPKGDLTVLLVYAGFDDPNARDIGDQPLDGWENENESNNSAATRPPKADIRDLWYKDFNDFTTYANDPDVGYISKYYHAMSGGTFRMIAKEFTDANGDPIRVNIDPTGKSGWGAMNTAVLNKMNAINPNFNVTGLDTRENFDYSTRYKFDQTNTTSNPADGIADYVVIIYRYSDNWSNQPVNGMKNWPGSSGGFSSFSNSFSSSINGLSFDQSGHTLCKGAAGNAHSTFIHEVAHELYNCPHYMAANSANGQRFERNTVQMGMMRMSDVSTYNTAAMAWERYILGWIDLEANGVSANIETENDLQNGGVYVLRDYMTYGDAIRVNLPFTNQYIWIENHQGLSDFDVKPYDGSNMTININGGGTESALVGSADNGLYIYVEDFGKTRDDPNGISLTKTNAINQLSANGNYDYNIESTVYGTKWGWNIRNFERESENPYSGSNPLSIFQYDYDGDGEINIDYYDFNRTSGLEYETINREFNPNSSSYQLMWSSWGGVNSNASGYRRSDAFIENDKLSSYSNPPLRPTLIYNQFNNVYSKPYKLHGLVIEVTDAITDAATGSTNYEITISYEAVDVENNTRFTGNIILPDITSNGASSMDGLVDLNVQNGTVLTIDKTGTPNSRNHAQHGLYIPSNLKLENSILNIETGAELIVKNESTLEIAPNAKIIANGTSKITIEETANLLFHQNAIIELKDNSELVIEGNLVLAENATFTFSGSGKVIFNGAVPNNINFASGSSIEIIGNGSSHVAVEIHQNDLYALKNNNASASNNIHFEDCKILMADNARLATDLPIELRSVVIDRLGSTDEPRGFEFYGQNNVYVAGCTFSNCRYGIKANNNIGGAPITILNSTFTNCKSGLYTIGAGANLSTCNFNNNTEHGWMAKGMYFESKLLSSNFNNNGDDGINFNGKHIGGLRLYDVTANNNGESGVDGDGYFFKSGCSHLQNNNLNGVIFRGNAMYLTNNKVKNTSRNYFDGNQDAITYNGYALYIDEGRNDLQASGSQFNIKGEVWPYFNRWGAVKYNSIFCDDNIFNGTAASNLANSTGNCFVENVSMFGGGSSTMANVVGSTLSGPIGACQFIDIADPWGRYHGQALAYYSNRTAPVLVFENPSHEFHNLTIDEAVDETIEHFYDEQIAHTAVLTISRASDILNYDFENELDSHSLTLYYDAYNIMLEAATKGIETGEIICNPDSALPLPIQTVINTQNFLLDEINYAYTSDRYWHKYTISLNKAMIYRVARQHSQAINELNNIQSWVATVDEVELDYITCHTQYELDLLDGTIDIYGVDLDSIYTCVDTIGGGGGSVPFFSNIEEELKNQETIINVYPNPSNGISTIEIKNSSENRITYEIYTLSGQEVQNGNLVLNDNGIGNIDYQTLPKGIYLLKVNVNGQEQQLKLFKE